MTDVTENRGQAEGKLSAADEQVLRELTERAPDLGDLCRGPAQSRARLVHLELVAWPSGIQRKTTIPLVWSAQGRC